MTPTEILDLPMAQNDAEAATIRDYLKALLSTVWKEKESFSGKRPFGNSGWQYDVYPALIKAKAISGKLDEYGYVDECDDAAADTIIQSAIAAL